MEHENQLLGEFLLAAENSLGVGFEDSDIELFLPELTKSLEEFSKGKSINKTLLKQWAKKATKDFLICLNTTPEWISQDEVPIWPFLDGKPMYFIDQIDTGDDAKSKSILNGRMRVYVFAGDKPVEGGYSVEFKTIYMAY